MNPALIEAKAVRVRFRDRVRVSSSKKKSHSQLEGLAHDATSLAPSCLPPGASKISITEWLLFHFPGTAFASDTMLPGPNSESRVY